MFNKVIRSPNDNHVRHKRCREVIFTTVAGDFCLNERLKVEQSFLQNEEGYRDGSELQKGKKQGLVTQ